MSRATNRRFGGAPYATASPDRSGAPAPGWAGQQASAETQYFDEMTDNEQDEYNRITPFVGTVGGRTERDGIRMPLLRSL